MLKWQQYPVSKIVRSCSQFPAILKEIPDYPKKLYFKGKLDIKKSHTLAIIGSRRFTAYGKQVAENLIAGLAGYDIIIVSGLALGIDSIAHRVALQNKLTTWAVIGRGIDKVYPATHERLACEIVENSGAVITEEEAGTPAEPFRFPKRNRIIAGLSEAVLVIEAAERSGTLITANQALGYGRDVLAVPQNIFNLNGKGTNWLISQGAKLVQSPDDILQELGIEAQNSKLKDLTNLSPLEKRIFEAISREEKSSDELSRRLKIKPEEANQYLMKMLLAGIVKRQTNGKFVIKIYNYF